MRWSSTAVHTFAVGPWVGNFGSCALGNLEFDAFESIGPPYNTDSTWHNYGPGGTPIWSGGAPPNYPVLDITQYHTYGLRTTTDASTGIRYCTWIDNRLQGCHTIPVGEIGLTTAQVTTSPGTDEFITGVTTDGSDLTSNFDQYIKRMTVWSCPNWQSANQVACKTSTIDPGGY